MSQEVIHVYFMPGMAASSTIFEYIKLPEDQFIVHRLDWFVPEPEESLEDYAKRMILKIEHKNPVLLGVSFGGLLVQEMSKLLKVKKLIIVSSVKTKHELPRRMKIAKRTKAYKLLPTQFISNVEILAKYVFGETATKRVALYKKYLSMSDKHYLDWAIEQMINWDQSTTNHDIVHIHGEKDAVFPIRNIKECIKIPNGTHIMIINKYKWFNENLPRIILS